MGENNDTGMTAREATTIPDRVYTQLTKSFVPAVKNISGSGNALLKSYDQLQRDSGAYIHSINELVNSADSASEGSKEYARQLADIFKEYAKAVHAHQKTVDEFRQIIEKISHYYREEKVKIKEMHETYQKAEKDIQRQVKKGAKNNRDVDNFHLTQANLWNHQQEMRYKFFYTKHKNWLQTYLNVIDKTDLPLLRREMSNSEQANEHEQHEQHEQHRQTDTIVNATAEMTHHKPDEHEQRQERETPRESRVSTRNEELHRATVTTNGHTHEQDDEKSQTESQNSSPGGTISRVPSMRRDTEHSTGVALVSNTKRHSQLVPQNVEPRRTSTLQDRVVYDAKPVPLPIRQERPDEGVTFSTGMTLSPGIPSQAPQAHSTFDSDLEETVRYVPPPPAVLPPGIPRAPGERKFPGAVPVFGMLPSNDAAAARYQPPANDNRLYANSVTQYDSGYQPPRSRSPIPPVQTQNTSYMNSPEFPRRYNDTSYVITAEELNRPKYVVEADYNPGVSPAHRPPPKTNAAAEKVMVPAPFLPSQYGSILIVNDDFNASSGEQITVNRGDKVTLLKCGTRGWVFVKETVSGRTGWIPSPYINK
ncbi:hypothetical protein WR25_04026 [Diploscapter pachys]|uniref:SH3 domain-containing protein n=1 Tax=Diploscapter pachys TaxID=2018661 RepID=A0A2A2KM12_9BILA|nr:hypothetical protein WR25_04026 [Diploscapter pachys]